MRNPTVRNKFSSCSGVKGHFILLSNETKRHVFWNSVGMRTQTRLTPQVRKTPFIVMNFLLQKEDNTSETMLACDKEKMVAFSFCGQYAFIQFPSVWLGTGISFVNQNVKFASTSQAASKKCSAEILRRPRCCRWESLETTQNAWKKQCHGSLASKFKDVIDILFQRIHVCANLGKFTSNHNFRKPAKRKNAVERMAEIYMIASWIYLFHCFLSENNLASRSWVQKNCWTGCMVLHH